MSAVRRKEGGFALVMVVAMMLMLVAVTTAILSTARSSIDVAGGIEARAKRMALADGAVATALAHVRAERPIPASVDGIKLEVVDQSLLLDVNTVTLDRLRQELASSGRAEADDWLESIASRRSAFANRGIGWYLDARAIETQTDLAHIMGVDVADPVLDRLTTYGSDTESRAALRVRAIQENGTILRDVIVSIEGTPRIQDWR